MQYDGWRDRKYCEDTTVRQFFGLQILILMSVYYSSFHPGCWAASSGLLLVSRAATAAGPAF